jgi:hypothetical protein
LPVALSDSVPLVRFPEQKGSASHCRWCVIRLSALFSFSFLIHRERKRQRWPLRVVFSYLLLCFCFSLSLPSLHLLFSPEAEAAALATAGGVDGCRQRSHAPRKHHHIAAVSVHGAVPHRVRNGQVVLSGKGDQPERGRDDVEACDVVRAPPAQPLGGREGAVHDRLHVCVCVCGGGGG